MTHTTEPAGHGGAITVLRGHLVDQAALHGVLARLRDIGLPLISVARVDPNAEKNAAPRPRKNRDEPTARARSRAASDTRHQ